jgi:hypothetical protein
MAIAAASYFIPPSQVALIQKVVDSIKKHAPGTLLTLEVLNEANQSTDPSEKYQKIVSCFKLSEDQTKNEAYHKLCYLIIVDLSDGKLTWQEASGIAQVYYDEVYKPSLKQAA